MRKEYEIRKEMNRLSSVKGSGTELISIYVPPNFSLSDEINKLKEEYNQSGNIKSKATRLNVQGAIDKIIQYLRLFKKLPDNGIAVFCGNISKEQAKPNIELFSIEPMEPIKANIYRCDSSFLLEPLEVILEAKDIYCLVVLDGREATIAILKGTHVTVEDKLHSFAHAKVHKGGQSANRYQRGTEESINDFYKSISDSINAIFEKYNFKIKGLIVGGPGPSKENFVKAKHLNYQIKILGVFDTGYTDEHMGINELLEKSKELLVEQSVIQERKLMERFLREVSNKGLAASGYENVKKVLLSNNVSILLISEDYELSKVYYKCSLCNAEIERFEEGFESMSLQHSCGGKLEEQKREDAIEELLNIAERNNVEVEFISGESQYGKELLLGFHGIAAILKYKQ